MHPKDHHFFSTVLGSTDGDSKYEGPPNSTGSLTSAFKSRKPKGTEFTASAPPATLESPASQAPSAALKAPEQEQAASKKGSGRRFVKAGQTKQRPGIKTSWRRSRFESDYLPDLPIATSRVSSLRKHSANTAILKKKVEDYVWEGRKGLSWANFREASSGSL